jgi:hypothetical protein
MPHEPTVRYAPKTGRPRRAPASDRACLPEREEVLRHVADGPLDLALGLGSVGTTGPSAKLPVIGKAQELGVFHQTAAIQALVFDERPPPTPWQAEVRKIYLTLVTRWSLEAHYRVQHHGTNLAHVLLYLRVTAGAPRGLDFLVQPNSSQRGIGL